MPELMVKLTREELSRLQIGIIVESWGSKEFGRLRRLYKETFPSAKVRAKNAQLYRRFYKWHLVTGFPKSAVFHPKTIIQIQKLVEFFVNN